MTTDIAISGETDTFLDDGNDLAVVGGNDRLEQHVYLNVGDELEQLLSDQLTGQSLSEAEDAVRRGLEQTEDVEEVLSVSIDRYDRADSVIYVTATATDETQNLEIQV